MTLEIFPTSKLKTDAKLIILENDEGWAQRINEAISIFVEFSKVIVVNSIPQLEATLKNMDSLFVLTIDIRLGSESNHNSDGAIWIMERLNEYKIHFGFEESFLPFYIISGELSDHSVATFRKTTNLQQSQIVRKTKWADYKWDLCNHLQEVLRHYIDSEYIPLSERPFATINFENNEDPIIFTIKAYFENHEIVSDNQTFKVRSQKEYTIQLNADFNDNIQEFSIKDGMLRTYVHGVGVTSIPEANEIPINVSGTKKEYTVKFKVTFDPEIINNAHYMYIPIYYYGRQLHMFRCSIVVEKN